jgi:hypothetical protein
MLLSRELLIPIHHRQSRSLGKKYALFKKQNNDWDDDVKNDKDVKKLSEDDSSIVLCDPCSNAKKSKNYGVVRVVGVVRACAINLLVGIGLITKKL